MLYRTAVPAEAPAAAAAGGVPDGASGAAPGAASGSDPGAVPAALPQAEVAFRDWFRQRPDRDRFAGRRYPVYVVAAEGGGIYAALHAASALGGLQDRCPAFADHLFAISSVSGGSLGAATFAAGLKLSLIHI